MPEFHFSEKHSDNPLNPLCEEMEYLCNHKIDLIKNICFRQIGEKEEAGTLMLRQGVNFLQNETQI